MKIGAHVSIAGGIANAPSRAFTLGCECFQIFSRSPQGGNSPKLDSKTVESFLKECIKYNLPNYYIHTPYYINLASKNPQVRFASQSIIKEEVERGCVIGAKYVVTHLGSVRDLGKAQGLRGIIDGLKRVIDSDTYSTKLLIENSAGQGFTIGDKFEMLAEILDKVGHSELGICLDTAHLFASGYDISNKRAVIKILDEFSSIIGLGRLKLLHGNDSKAGLGERKDRHEHIGKGKIGIEGFSTIVNEPRLKDIDIIIETPSEKVADDIENLKKLKNLRNKKIPQK
jgi:deoxyribonuclease-4